MTPEPASTAAAAALPGLGATALVGALTGLDYWTLLGGFVGALLALRRQPPPGPAWAAIRLVGMALLSLFFAWALVELLPTLMRSFGAEAVTELGKGRVIVASIFGYYAQDKILPGCGRVIDGFFARFGGRPEGEGE